MKSLIPACTYLLLIVTSTIHYYSLFTMTAPAPLIEQRHTTDQANSSFTVL